jgi:hypothetical protein
MTTVTAVSVDDFLGRGQSEIFATDIRDEVELRRDFIADTREAGDDPYEDDEAKLAQLLRFVEDVERATGGSFDTATLVPEDLFPDYIRDWAEEAYGLPQEISNCVDWTKFADRCRDSYTAVPLGDDTVLVKV